MTTRKFGLLGLALGMSILAACEPKSEVIVQPPTVIDSPTVALNLVPDTATINVGPNQVTLVPIVTGTTNQAVTFSSSNTSVATVTAAGVVSGVAAGRAVITAVSTADPRARDASVINVIVPPPPPPAVAPTINIASITQGGTQFPVNTSNVNGQVDVTVNADIPVGSNVTSLRVSLVTSAGAATEVCRQTFTGTGELEVNGQVPVQIVCSINTADFDAATGAPRFPNGSYTIRAELLNATGGVAASATSQTLTLNNTSFIALRAIESSFFAPGTTTARACVNSGSDPRSIGGAGTRWCGGDLTINLTPVIFGTVGGTLANDRVASATVQVITSGVGVNGLSNCDNTLNMLTAGSVAPEDKQNTFPAIYAANLATAGVTTLEDGSARNGAGYVAFAGTPIGAVAAAGTITDADGDGAQDFPGCPSVTVALQDTDASNGLSVTFSAANDPDCVTTGLCTGTTGFLAQNGIKDIEDVVAIRVLSTTVGGQAGPVCINPDPRSNPLPNGAIFGGCGTGFGGGSAANVAFFPTGILRVDNFAPRVLEFDISPTGCLTAGAGGGCFVNGTFAFAPRAGFFQSADYGSDSQNANTTFAAGTTTTGVTTVRTGADLAPGSVTANDLYIRATVSDALGNTTNRFPAGGASCAAPPAGSVGEVCFPGATATTTTAGNQVRFGVDLQAPVIDGTLTAQPPNNGANDGTTFTIVYRDEGIGPSGFTATPVWVKVERITTAGTVCLNAETGAFIVGSGSCASGPLGNGFIATDGTFTTPAGVMGYYRFTYYVQDAAGNNSSQVTVLTLIDAAAPAVAGIVAPSVITGNASATFSASTTDNVDLGDVQPYTSYTTVGRFLQEPSTAIGSYGPPLETSMTATATIANFIRSLETTTAGGAPTGAIDRADAISFNVRDQAGVVDANACPAVGAPNTSAGNCTNRTDDITANVAAGIPAGTTGNGERTFGNANIGVATFTLAQNNATVCNSTGTGAGQPCPTNPSTTTLTATATGPTATFATPFVRVNFYYVDPATGRAILIGTSSAPSVTDSGPVGATVRSYIYTATWNPANLAAAAYEVFAVGVHSSGMGLQSPSVVTTVAVD